MHTAKNTRLFFNLIAAGLLVVGLSLLPNATPELAHADPGELYVSPSGSGTACTQIDPCALQDALDIAEENGEDDVLYLAAGTYQGNFEYRPPSSEQKSLTVTGEPGTTAEDVILDGQNNGRVLEIYDYSGASGFEIKVHRITIENGDSTGEGHPEGGGIQATVSYGDLYITHCIIKNNTAREYGGGIYGAP